MTETREKKLDNKVLTKDDISRLWSVLNSEYILSNKKENHHTSLKMQIRCSDETRYESDGDELLSEGNIFDLKRVKSIDFEYYDYSDKKKININLRNDLIIDGNLTVGGNDTHWVAGIFNKLEIIFDSVKPQNNWVSRHEISLTLIGSFILANVFTKILFFIYSENITNITSAYWFILFAFMFLSFLIFVSIISWVIKLWPSIEFDFGPEHKKIEKTRRVRFLVLWSSLVLPLILNLIPF